MDRCPSCGDRVIPLWRPVLRLSGDRFRCLSCAVWLVYRDGHTARPVKPRSLLFFITVLLFVPPLTVMIPIASAFLARQIPPEALLVIPGIFIVVALWSARARYRRTTLVVAEYQQDLPVLDFARSLRDLWQTPGGRMAIACVGIFVIELAIWFWIAAMLIPPCMGKL